MFLNKLVVRVQLFIRHYMETMPPHNANVLFNLSGFFFGFLNFFTCVKLIEMLLKTISLSTHLLIFTTNL